MQSSVQYSSESIYNILRDEIINLQLKPGQLLSEHELSERFNVSRSPIRLAIRRLADQELIEVMPYKGNFVSLLNFEEIKQLIYMRIAIEQKVICDFMDIAQPIVLEKLQYIIRKQIVLVESENFSEAHFYKLDSQLHEVWFKETDKLKLWEIIQQFQVQYTRFRMLDIVSVQSYQQIINEHTKLLELIRENNHDEVEKALTTHLNGGINRLYDKIKTDFSDYFLKDNL